MSNLFVDIHTHSNKSTEGTIKIVCLELDRPYDYKIDFVSSGIHPWKIDDSVNDLLTTLQQRISFSNTVALGEVGLDRNSDCDFEVQKEVLIKQLEINRNFNKPVIIHAVKTHSDILKIKQAYREQVWIIHGFTGNLTTAQQYISAGCYLSFGPKILTPSPSLSFTISNIPIGSIFLETDAQNDFSIEQIYQQMGQLKSFSQETLQKAICQNFTKLFNQVLT